MDHRGASGSDPETGDGAGILLQLPDAFFRRVVREDARARPAAAGRLRRRHGVPAARARPAPALRGAVRPHLRRGGPPRARLARRARAVRPHRRARARAPSRRPPAVRRAPRRRRRGVRAQALRDPPARREGGRAPAASRWPTSPSSRSRRAPSSTRACSAPASSTPTTPTCATPDIASALALVHSRFSTNTLGTWDLAHPFNLLAHNGEINTVRGNRALAARRASRSCAATLFGGDLQKLFPIAEERWSDSAKLDDDARAAGARRPLAAARPDDADARRPGPTRRSTCRTTCARSTSTTPRSSSRGTARPRSRFTDGAPGRRDARPQRPAPGALRA